MDTFAEIAKAGAGGRLDELIFPAPIPFTEKAITLEAHDTSCAPCALEQINTKDALDKALAEKRLEYAPFLRKLSLPVKSFRKIWHLDTFTWRKNANDEPQTITLPHYGEPLGAAASVYETTFTLTPSVNNHIFIVLKGADYKANVFVNEKLAGTHEGFFATFSFDITSLLSTGENHLKIELSNDYVMMGNTSEADATAYCGDKIYAASGPGYDDPARGWHHCPPACGLFDKVFLEERPSVYVSDIFTRTREDDVQVWAEVNSCGYQREKVYLSVSLYGQNHSETCFEGLLIEPSTGKEIGVGDTFTEVLSLRDHTLGTRLPLLCAKGRNLFKFSIPRKNLKTWQLDAPYLYQLQISLLDKNKNILDNFESTFGIRTFTQDIDSTPKGMFYLNGEKIRLRGANTMGFEQQDVMSGDFDQLINDILLAKLCNMNFLRLTQRPVQQEVYEYCDALGLMTQTDLPLFGCLRRHQFCEAVRQAEEMERHVRGHACNVVISYINEPFPNANNIPSMNLTRGELEQFFAAADIVVHLNNPDRVIKHVDGDYDPPSKDMPDNHCYPLWYNGHGIDIGRLNKGYWMQVKPDWYYGCGEFGIEGLECEEVMRKYYPKEWLPQGSAEDASWRASGIVGAQTDAFYHFFYEKQLSLAAWIKESQSFQAFGLRLMTEAFRRDARMVSFAMHLFIDAFPSGWMKTIMDCDRNPKPAYFAYKNALSPILLSLRCDKFSFVGGDCAKIEVWLCNDTLECGDEYTLHLEVQSNNAAYAYAQESVSLISSDVSYAGTATISLPEVSTQEVFTLRGVLCQGDKAICENSFDFDVYPAVHCEGEMRVRDISQITDDDIQSVQTGAILFVEPLSEGVYKLFDTSITVKPSGMSPIYFAARDTGHPWVNGFTPYAFRYFYSKEADRLVPLAQSTFTAEGLSPVLTSRNLNENGEWAEVMLLGEKRLGKGRIIISQIAHSLLRENAAGKTLLSHIQEHAEREKI